MKLQTQPFFNAITNTLTTKMSSFRSHRFLTGSIQPSTSIPMSRSASESQHLKTDIPNNADLHHIQSVPPANSRLDALEAKSVVQTHSISAEAKLNALGYKVELYSSKGQQPSLELVEHLVSKDSVFGKQWPQYVGVEVAQGETGWHTALTDPSLLPPRYLSVLKGPKDDIVGMNFGFFLPESNVGFSIYRVLDESKRGQGIGKLMSRGFHEKTAETYRSDYGRDLKGFIAEAYKKFDMEHEGVVHSEYFDTSRIGAKVVPIDYVQPDLYGQDYLDEASAEVKASIQRDRHGFNLVCYEMPGHEGLAQNAELLKSALKEFFKTYSYSNPEKGEGLKLFDRMAKELDAMSSKMTKNDYIKQVLNDTASLDVDRFKPAEIQYYKALLRFAERV